MSAINYLLLNVQVMYTEYNIAHIYIVLPTFRLVLVAQVNKILLLPPTVDPPVFEKESANFHSQTLHALTLTLCMINEKTIVVHAKCRCIACNYS